MLLLMRRPGEAIVADGKLLRVKTVTPTHVEFELSDIMQHRGTRAKEARGTSNEAFFKTNK